MDTASQIKIHEETWWVVPEIAAREHANNIFKVLWNVLNIAKLKIENDKNKIIDCHCEWNEAIQKTWINVETGLLHTSQWQFLNSINYIAVTMTPWLMPSLLTWITVARTISISLNIPLVEINHIESHIFSNYLERKESDINYPLVCLTVSGGHNEIYHMKDMFDFTKVWWTQDDSAGEAFDKVAKMMWLGYPGWPIVSKLAEEYCKKTVITNDSEVIQGTWNNVETGLLRKNSQWQIHGSNLFPRSWLDKDELNFSFSWLKSSVKREVDKRIINNGQLIINNDWEKSLLNELLMIKNKWDTLLTSLDRQKISYEFQEAVIEVLATKLVSAAEKYWVKTVMLAWWVSANDRLKEYIEKLIVWKGIKFVYPVKKLYCMDNAAMVWINGYYKIKKA
jgi:N6-L-threonylcarbamoyladenine synthase